MKTHQDVDRRSLSLCRAIVEKIEADPLRSGLEKAKAVCRRWEARSPSRCNREWLELLEKPWDEVREMLLEVSEQGQRLRQNSPFCGVLTPGERWDIYRRFRDHEKTGS